MRVQEQEEGDTNTIAGAYKRRATRKKSEKERKPGDDRGEKFRSVGQKEIPFREFLVSDLDRFFPS